MVAYTKKRTKIERIMTPTLILTEVSYSFTFNSQHCDSKMQQTLKLSIQFQINDEKISIILINKKQLK